MPVTRSQRKNPGRLFFRDSTVPHFLQEGFGFMSSKYPFTVVGFFLMAISQSPMTLSAQIFNLQHFAEILGKCRQNLLN